MRILLTTEGTYPYSRGGVSTWAHELVTGMPEHEFVIDAVVGNPHVAPVFPVPPNTEVRTIPLWGTETVDEYVATRPRMPRRSRALREQDFVERLLPAYEEVVANLLGPRPPLALGSAIADIAAYCRDHDLRAALRDPRCWQLVRGRLSEHPLFDEMSMADAIDISRSLYRYLTPLAVAPPAVDLAHSSGAALCALPALAVKLRTGVPLLLTEHGVYVRERVLQLVRDDAPLTRKALLSNLYRAVARCAYAHADVVLPVCAYNALWERELGVEASRLRVVYNGVDPADFPPREVALPRPTIAYVGRIEPLKDVRGLITAVGMVRRQVPDVLLRIHGPEDDAGYAARCRAAVATAGLEDAVLFEGPTTNPARAYQESDVVVLCSVSEGFPYTVVEAMGSGRPVVATAVGGVPEALDRRDLLVEPQNPRALADCLVRVLRLCPNERRAIGEQLRARVVQSFSRKRFLEEYRALYRGDIREHAA
jgi:glycosyltransferase involved in cell wall biosynthesis